MLCLQLKSDIATVLTCVASFTARAQCRNIYLLSDTNGSTKRILWVITNQIQQHFRVVQAMEVTTKRKESTWGRRTHKRHEGYSWIDFTATEISYRVKWPGSISVAMIRTGPTLWIPWTWTLYILKQDTLNNVLWNKWFKKCPTLH